MKEIKLTINKEIKGDGGFPIPAGSVVDVKIASINLGEKEDSLIYFCEIFYNEEELAKKSSSLKVIGIHDNDESRRSNSNVFGNRLKGSEFNILVESVDGRLSLTDESIASLKPLVIKNISEMIPNISKEDIS